tara:strand:+ start:16405 stop:17400 length:996 start_codon:yes stop_codon:yes gene_type:complete
MKTKIYPNKLKKGDHIRIVAPSRSLGIIGENDIKYAKNKLEGLGFTVSFGKHVNEMDDFASSSIESRVEDIHEAFSDKSVDGILTVIGGYNSNQLVDYLDYDLIKNNPKVLCGFSDITALTLAIYSQTGLVGYSGPHFSSWGMQKGFEHSFEYFLKCCVEKDSYDVIASKEYSDDLWFLDQENRTFIENEGIWVLNDIKGSFEGTLIGTHMRCLNSYQGTKYWPGLDNSVLFIEEDEEIDALLFDRQLQSLIHQSDFSGVKAIVIGRFQKNSKMTQDLLSQIIKTKKELKDILVLANADFGHTTPLTTLPIGGCAQVSNDENGTKITILEH